MTIKWTKKCRCLKKINKKKCNEKNFKEMNKSINIIFLKNVFLALREIHIYLCIVLCLAAFLRCDCCAHECSVNRYNFSYDFCFLKISSFYLTC